MKILIIDDEHLVRWFLERALKRWKFDVASVSNVQEAVERLDTETFDLIFTDLKMPAGNGSIIIEKVLRMPEPPNLVICSAYITPEMETEYKNKGILTIKKPFKLNELEKIIKITTT